MGSLTTLAKTVEAEKKAAAWKRYLELLEHGGQQDALELLEAGRALGRSAADIEREQRWLQTVRAQQGVIQAGKGLRDEQCALERRITEMEEAIRAEIVKLRIPLLEMKKQHGELVAREQNASWASQALEKMKYENLELVEALGMPLPYGVNPQQR